MYCRELHADHTIYVFFFLKETATPEISPLPLPDVFGSRDREAAQKRTGEGGVREVFLVKYPQPRQELLLGFLREKFPDLNLPEPEAEPVNSLSLQALRDRNAATN